MNRLKLAATENKQRDNDKLYDVIESYLEDIDNNLDNIKSQLQYFPDGNFSDNEEEIENEKKKIWENMTYEVDNIESFADEIKSTVGEAKDNGMFNEQQLGAGNEQIEELNDTLNELNGELTNIEDEHGDLQNEISSIQSQIDSVQSKLENIEASTTRLKKEAGFRFICQVHDAIAESANEIIKECSDFAGDHLQYHYYEQSISIIEGAAYDIYTYLNEARDMNERMGSGIDNKNSRIYDLEKEIDEITSNIEDANYTKRNLEDQLDELRDLLSELESAL